jgi:hypothetical protein
MFTIGGTAMSCYVKDLHIEIKNRDRTARFIRVVIVGIIYTQHEYVFDVDYYDNDSVHATKEYYSASTEALATADLMRLINDNLILGRISM